MENQYLYKFSRYIFIFINFAFFYVARAQEPQTSRLYGVIRVHLGLDSASDRKHLEGYINTVLYSKLSSRGYYDKSVKNLKIISQSADGFPTQVEADFQITASWASRRKYDIRTVELYLSDKIPYYMHFKDEPKSAFFTPLLRFGDVEDNYSPRAIEILKHLQDSLNAPMRNLIIAKSEVSFNEVLKQQESIPAEYDVAGCLIDTTRWIVEHVRTGEVTEIVGYENGQSGNGSIISYPIKKTIPTFSDVSVKKAAMFNNCSHTIVLRGITQNHTVNINEETITYIDASMSIPAKTFIDPVTMRPYSKGPGTGYFYYVSPVNRLRFR